jgi:hypothetical protein
MLHGMTVVTSVYFPQFFVHKELEQKGLKMKQVQIFQNATVNSARQMGNTKHSEYGYHVDIV